MKKSELKKYTVPTVCNIVGADSRSRFALGKKYKNQSHSAEEWIKLLKEYGYSEKFQDMVSDQT